MLAAIFMRRLLTLTLLTYSALTFGQTDKVIKIRFDGVYQSDMDIDKEDMDTTWTYIRFYPGGQVISVSTEGTPWEIKDWFKLDFENVSKGDCEVNGSRLRFSTTSKSGTVNYKGKFINDKTMLLRVKSLINGYKGREKYYFIKVDDLK
jgi:hypothetical protein